MSLFFQVLWPCDKFEPTIVIIFLLVNFKMVFRVPTANILDYNNDTLSKLVYRYVNGYLFSISDTAKDSVYGSAIFPQKT